MSRISAFGVIHKADRPYNPEAPLGYRKPPRRISSTLIGAGVGATAAADELGQGPRMSGKEALALGALGAGIGAAMGGTAFHAGRKVGYKRVQRKYPKS